MLAQTPSEPAAEKPAEISEQEISALVLRAQQNNPDAFAQLIRALEAPLHRQARFLTGDSHQSLDLLQDTLLEAWKHLARFDGRARFFTWLCSIMLHRHYDWLRRLRLRFTVQIDATPEFDAPSEAPCPSDTADALDRAALVRHCLDQLPARQRTIVYLRFYAGESLEGIAAITHCNLGTVKSRLFHALARLARMQKLKELQNDHSGTQL